MKKKKEVEKNTEGTSFTSGFCNLVIALHISAKELSSVMLSDLPFLVLVSQIMNFWTLFPRKVRAKTKMRTIWISTISTESKDKKNKSRIYKLL